MIATNGAECVTGMSDVSSRGNDGQWSGLIFRLPSMDRRVAQSAGVVAKSKSLPKYSYHPSRDPLRDPAALLSQEGSLFTLTSNQTITE